MFLAMPFFYLCYSQIDGNLGTVAAGMTLNVRSSLSTSLCIAHAFSSGHPQRPDSKSESNCHHHHHSHHVRRGRRWPRTVLTNSHRDFFGYPALRKAGINFTPIKRITTGFFIASLGESSRDRIVPVC